MDEKDKVNSNADKQDKNNDEGKKSFNAEQQLLVDAIVEKRLKKQKAKFDSKIKSLEGSSLDVLADKVGIKADDIEKLLADSVKSKKLEIASKKAEELGIEPEFMVYINDLIAENKQFKEKEEVINEIAKKKKTDKEEIDKQIKLFEDEFEDIDITKLNNDSRFQSFYGKLDKKVTLIDAYKEYSSLVGDAKQREMEKQLSKDKRSTGSGSSAGGNSDNYGASAEQLALCKENDLDVKLFMEQVNNSIHHKK